MENHYGFAAYTYVLDNPMTFMDPLGMDTLNFNTQEAVQRGDDIRLPDGNVVGNSIADVHVSPKGDMLSVPFYRGGEQVMEPVKGTWNYLWHAFAPREYNGYEVDNSGKVIPPMLGGIVDMTPVGRIRMLGIVVKGGKKILPALDATGKVHGALPRIKDLGKYSKEELQIFYQELKQSVQQRIKVTSRMGRDRAHGQRQGAEQDLIKAIEKHLQNR